MDDRAAVALGVFALLTVISLLVLFWVSRSRSPLAGRLIVLGLFLALIALWYGLLTSLPTRDHVPVPFGNGGLADTALRLSAVMILGGIVLTLLTRETVPPLPATPEAQRNVPSSL